MRTRSLNLTTVHRKHDSWTPVQESLGDTLANQLDRFTCQASQIEFFTILCVRGEFLEKDCGSLYGFLTERALGCCELEGVGDFVGEVADD